MHSDDEQQKRIMTLNEQFRSFGTSRLPLSEVLDDIRFIVAGNKIYRAPAKNTFHQFLMGFGMDRLGRDWIKMGRSTGFHHPLLQHLQLGTKNIKLSISEKEAPNLYAMNADLFAFLCFSYDLFTIEDNVEIQGKLLKRIRLAENYYGARYELYVAATFVRGGFGIAFENEKNSTSHCEFVATHAKTKKQFSVEAKHRTRAGTNEQNPPVGILKLVQKALKKKANHERIIFTEVNLSADKNEFFQENWHIEVAGILKQLESKQDPKNPWPPAITFFTNRTISPWQDANTSNRTVLFTGFNHHLFGQKDTEKVKAELPELGPLYNAALKLAEPPPTFFGQGVVS